MIGGGLALFDAAGDLVGVIQGSRDALTNGPTVGNTVQILASGAGFAGNLGGRAAAAKGRSGIAPTRMHSAADLDRIADIRSSLGIGKKRNIAFGEGHINGKDFGEVLGVSGQNTPGVRMPSDRVFRTGVDEFDRAFDGEVFVLENFARRLKPTDSGTLRLVSERKFCDSCSDVIAQFREMFPNIRLILVDGTP